MSDSVEARLVLAKRAEDCANCRSSAYPSEVLLECAAALRAIDAAARTIEPYAWVLTWPDGAQSFTRRKPNESVFEMDLLVTPLFTNAAQPSREAREKEITRLATIEECALIAEGFDAACNSPRMKLFEEAGLVLAIYKRDGEIGAAIRALGHSSTEDK